MSERVILSEADIVSRSRGVAKPAAYAVFPRATRVKSSLPHFEGVAIQVMAAPPLGARFVEYELLVEAGGGTTRPIDDGLEQFLFVLEGNTQLEIKGEKHALVTGSYAWLPPGQAFALSNKSDALSRLIWFRRRYELVAGLAVPEAIIGNEKDVPAVPVTTFHTQYLIPWENPAFDMAFNILNFQPGVYFSVVETHIMEHGLYMLDGTGIYWLNGDYHEVQRDDFIYMAPFCPQYFYATGWKRARYLLYKDINRDYASAL